MGSEFFEPDFVVVMEAGFVVVDENRSCDVHRVAKYNAVVDPAAEHEFFDSVGDVDKTTAAFDFEPEVFGEGFHAGENSMRR